ncbi:MAG TPA: Type 1 glutamine amidotransferase-like domain-containing protein [Microthrixaceae bacterium]|nr:Type 1 glutamine amidotransferase-like domain-containing protein [Microthrixaceae bacterium]
MSGTLALVGGAEWTEGCDFDAELLAASGRNEVLVIPTAAAYENPAHVVHRARAWFGGLGAEVSVLEVFRRSDAVSPAAAAQARGASFLYLAGGSPMHLRSVLKDTPLWDAIVAAFRDGAVLAGSAEGATVMCSHMVDTRGGAFTVGLDLLTEHTVIPHYDQWSEDKWHRTVRLAPRGMSVLGVDERTAAISDGSGWRSAGHGSVTAYRDGHRVDLGTLPAVSDG